MGADDTQKQFSKDDHKFVWKAWLSYRGWLMEMHPQINTEVNHDALLKPSQIWRAWLYQQYQLTGKTSKVVLYLYLYTYIHTFTYVSAYLNYTCPVWPLSCCALTPNFWQPNCSSQQNGRNSSDSSVSAMFVFIRGHTVNGWLKSICLTFTTTKSCTRGYLE